MIEQRPLAVQRAAALGSLRRQWNLEEGRPQHGRLDPLRIQRALRFLDLGQRLRRIILAPNRADFGEVQTELVQESRGSGHIFVNLIGGDTQANLGERCRAEAAVAGGDRRGGQRLAACVRVHAEIIALPGLRSRGNP